MPHISLDYETTSECDIKSCGGYKYGNSESTRILMFAVAEEQGHVLIWRYDQPDSLESKLAKSLLETAIKRGDRIYAHNAQFEVAISRYRLKADVGIDPPELSQWRDTMAMCNRAAINPSLEDAAKVLRLPYQKDKAGLSLIHIFSDQNKEVALYHPADKKVVHKVKHPLGEAEIKWDWLVTLQGERITLKAAWEKFIDYCRQDVEVERQVHKKLHKFELEGAILDSFQFDLRMNYRGVPVNRKALAHAQTLVEQYQERLGVRFKNKCGLTFSQNAKVLAWLKERGYPKESLAADTVELIAGGGYAGMTEEAVEVLQMRSLLSFAALGKIPAMLRACCDDGYVRGSTQWYGARTGRATGRIIQPQNMKKATIKDSELAYEMLLDGCPLSDFEDFWDSPLEVIASCIRHFIQPHEGLVLDGDFIGVEARIAPWLSGETEKLQSILDGKDQYKVMAADIVYNIPYDQVTKDQRTVGKPVELSCVYGTGGRGLMIALRDTHKVHKSLKECTAIVKKYRETFPRLVQTWRDIEDAAKDAIRDGKTTHVADGKLAFGRMTTEGIRYLIMRLPSGRKIFYPDPRVEKVFKKYTKEEMVEDAWKAERKGYEIDQISFYGKEEKKNTWGRTTTWGSRLFENACQAIGADFLNHGCIEATKRGYDIFMIVHDQALAYAAKPLEGFLEAICAKEPWAETFPLEASGAVTRWYLKD